VSCANCEKWSERYHQLVTEMMAMKRDGFTPPGTLPEPIEALMLPDVIRESIALVCEPGDPTWRRLEKLAWELKRSNSDDKVAQLISAGEPASL
jgi:hypothetical protein